MRAVNLIPPEERSGRGRQARAGSLSYVVIGALVAVLAAVTLMVMTSSDISESKADITRLEQQRAAAQERAEELGAFADFASMQESRTATVTALAQSRFDWERVMRELALVIPSDVWLVKLEGTVQPGVQLEQGASITLRDKVLGPALELIGCAASQNSVGRFAAALRDIDGVTRVAVYKSELPELSESESSAGSESSDECRTQDFIAQFEIVAAFDAVPVPAGATGETAPTQPTAPPAGEEAPPPSQSESQAATEQGVQEGQEAAKIAPGV